MLLIVMLSPLSNESVRRITSLRGEKEKKSTAIGIENKAITLIMGINEDVAEALLRVLADPFTLYLKTHKDGP